MTRSATVPTLRSRGRVVVPPAALAVAAAAGAAVLAWAVAVPLLGVDLRVGTEGAPRTVGIGSVVAAAAVAGLLGWALLAILVRSVPRAGTVWRAAAVVVLLLSLGGPVAMGVGTASVVVLLALHAVVAAVLVALLPRAVRR
ncbi:DUF6069 family protein [Geodermatophilus sp. DSM 45219]|uniref:DUF6069 family protein n=1 Tax=Geodermatophilus sp. DSM 45219 TaxID=1881103 RepID=UPI00087FCE1A|nr:DUF6069 family protein [Geodermatophilus sp. DSM 45219]SDO07746.1 hypothetical protein SAMN05428965_2716 [Geodermatophilus sp. DSM 45219]